MARVTDIGVLTGDEQWRLERGDGDEGGRGSRKKAARRSAAPTIGRGRVGVGVDWSRNLSLGSTNNALHFQTRGGRVFTWARVHVYICTGGRYRVNPNNFDVRLRSIKVLI